MNLAQATTLMTKLHALDKAYFNTGKSKVSDAQYDKLKDQLAAANKKLKSAKITKYLESTGTAETSGQKRNHPFYLPSLNKIKDDEPKHIPKYLKKVKSFWRMKDKPLQFGLGPKFDGSSVLHDYNNGTYTRSTTRGDGDVGRDVTPHIKELIRLGKVPGKIPQKGVVHVRSEVCLTRKDFAPWKGKKIDGYTYKEARNSANSYLVAKTVKKDFAKCITVVAFDCFDKDGNAVFPTKFKAVKAMAEWGFSSLFADHIQLIDETMDIKAHLDAMLEKVSSPDFPIECDGVVIEANSSHLRSAMRVGMEDKRPTHAMAYKYGVTTDKTAQVTKVLKLFWTAAADGARVPNVEYAPIKVGNTTLTNALAHNAANVEELGLTVGCEVKVVRSGGVIPQVVEVTKAAKGKKVTLPHRCECDTLLVRIGPDLYCTNDECQYTGAAKFSRACKFMNLDGLGSKGEEKLYEVCGSTSKLFTMNEAKLQALLGNAAGKRVHASIKKWYANCSWSDMMVVSGVFTKPGFSLASKNLEPMVKALGLKLGQPLPKLKNADIKAKVKGVAGGLFAIKWPEFVAFVNSI